ncbi:MAG: hypothetical protein H7Z37_10660 [Pyrinomonadaceae bacterium]|nr:hypothetical protein [Pyrinomonadaceae bacterium]
MLFAKYNSSRTTFTGLVSVFLLLCFAFFPPSSVMNAPTVDAEFVYCPLQKILVNRNPPKRAFQTNVFNRICALQTVKTNIFQNAFAKLSPFQIVGDEVEAENLIFAYLQHGDSAVKAFHGSPSQSPEKSSHLVSAETALGNSYKEFFALPLLMARTQICARPPTVFVAFVSKVFNFYDSAKLSPNCFSRPPPLFS